MMVELKTKFLEPEGEVRKNVLYRINKNRIIPVREKHDEHGTFQNAETVNLKYILEEGQYALLGKEYRPSGVSETGGKAADVLTCIIDDNSKKIYSLIFDIKRNISAFSDDLLKDGALVIAVRRVSDFIEQLNHTMSHKGKGILPNYKDDGYTETKTEVGIATIRFESEKFCKVAEFFEKLSGMKEPSNIQELQVYKLKNNLLPYIGEAAKMRDFANRKVFIGDDLYPLQVYLLEQVEDSEYAVTIKVKMN